MTGGISHQRPASGDSPEGGAEITNVPVAVPQFPAASRAHTRYVYVPGAVNARPAEYRPVPESKAAVRFATVWPLPSRVGMKTAGTPRSSVTTAGMFTVPRRFAGSGRP